MTTIEPTDFTHAFRAQKLAHIAAARIERLARLNALHHAEDAFAAHVRASHDGMSGEYGAHLIDQDLIALTEIGYAIGKLARLTKDKIGRAHFVSAVVQTLHVAVRLAESIDDVVTGPAWCVIAAAAEVEACDE